MQLRQLSDEQLHNASLMVAERERFTTLELLKHLSEIERRHLFSRYECDSLHSYCVKYLKMSDPQAGRRVKASRLLREIPVLEEKIADGTMTLTSVCQASSFFHREAQAGHKLATAEKIKVLASLDHQSTVKVERILLARSESPEIHVREVVKQRTSELTEIKIVADEAMLRDLNRLKEIWSHAMPGATYTQIIARLAAEAVRSQDPNLKAERAAARSAARQKRCEAATVDADSKQTAALPSTVGVSSTPHPARSRMIPSTVKHAVWIRDSGRCTFENSETGAVCESKHFVECDHIIPFARGGEHTTENLRLRCRAHNHQHSVESYGSPKANEWRSRRGSTVRDRSVEYP